MIMDILSLLREKGAFIPVASLLLAACIWLALAATVDAKSALTQAAQARAETRTQHQVLLRVEKQVDRLVDYQLNKKD